MFPRNKTVFSLRGNRPAAYNDVAVVKNNSLAGCNGALLFFKFNERLRFGKRMHDRFASRWLYRALAGYTQGSDGTAARNPVQILRNQPV